MKNKILNWITDHLKETITIKTSTQSISAGFAIGTFISILPIPGFSILIATAFVLMFKRTSKIAIFLAMAIWNPITLIPIYYYSYDVGMFLLKNVATQEYSLTVLNRVYHFSNDFLLGNFILSIIVSFVCYWIIHEYVKNKKSKKN